MSEGENGAQPDEVVASEPTPVTSVLQKLRNLGPLGDDEGQARARIMEKPIQSPIKYARSAILPLLFLLTNGINTAADQVLSDRLTQRPNPEVAAQFADLREFDDLAIPIVGMQKYGAATALEVYELIRKIELINEANTVRIK